VADSADPARVKAGIKTALAAFPTATVEDKTEYKQTIEEQLDQIVFLLYTPLAMSVVISFGEFGLLRAVGATSHSHGSPRARSRNGTSASTCPRRSLA
jgi:hypothetical protein